jgi:hypothetical protein
LLAGNRFSAEKEAGMPSCDNSGLSCYPNVFSSIAFVSLLQNRTMLIDQGFSMRVLKNFSMLVAHCPAPPHTGNAEQTKLIMAWRLSLL